MANNAVWSVVEDGSERTRRLANYCLPLFWLSCLAPEDEVVHESLDDEDDELVHLTIAAPRARARFDERQDAIDALTARIGADTSTFVREWSATLAGLTGAVRVDVTEIIAMTDDGEEELRRALTYFESPTTAAAQALFSITCITDVFGGKESARVGEYLMGYALSGRRDAP